LFLGFLWQNGLDELYPHLLKPVAFPFFRLVGVEKWLLTRVSGQFVSLIVFAALVLASPQAVRRWKRTLLSLGGGVVIIAAAHLLLSWAVYAIEAAHPDERMRGLLVEPLWVVNAALPLVLWLLFHHRTLGDFTRAESPDHPGQRKQAS